MVVVPEPAVKGGGALAAEAPHARARDRSRPGHRRCGRGRLLPARSAREPARLLPRAELPPARRLISPARDANGGLTSDGTTTSTWNSRPPRLVLEDGPRRQLRI